ncbi:hypothetical protein [Duganella sp. Dugasp56]|uniref:hypothetical protein n=1 Tax=Duganella sp. Dugasp56 TaxID=3243046 RepID=UPI0039B10637
MDHRLVPLKKSDLKFKYAASTTGGDDPAKRNVPDSAFLLIVTNGAKFCIS